MSGKETPQSAWAAFWRAVYMPFHAIVGLTFPQVRSLFAISMLCGIIALSMENWALMTFAYQSVTAGGEEDFTEWFKLLLERTRYNSGLQAWFSVILGLVVWGAEYLRAKWGDKEISAGQGTSKGADDGNDVA